MEFHYYQLLIVWAIVIILLLLLDSSCGLYTISNKMPKFKVVDASCNIHSYKEDVNKIDINIEYSNYCQLHYAWETILLRYATPLSDPIGVHFNDTEYIVRQK